MYSWEDCKMKSTVRSAKVSVYVQKGFVWGVFQVYTGVSWECLGSAWGGLSRGPNSKVYCWVYILFGLVNGDLTQLTLIMTGKNWSVAAPWSLDTRSTPNSPSHWTWSLVLPPGLNRTKLYFKLYACFQMTCVQQQFYLPCFGRGNLMPKKFSKFSVTFTAASNANDTWQSCV